MKKIIAILIVMGSLMSCNNFGSHLAEYSITGDATDVTVNYRDETGYNITEKVTLPWSRKVLVQDGNSVRLQANNEGVGTMYANVYWIQDTRTLTYRSTHNTTSLRIQGRIK